MNAIVQARLDEATRKTLATLARRFGWSPSEIVREGIRLVAARFPGSDRPRIAGVGEFSSGIRDLGSNKRHLTGFGGVAKGVQAPSRGSRKQPARSVLREVTKH